MCCRTRCLLAVVALAIAACALVGCIDGKTPSCGPSDGCGYDFADAPFANDGGSDAVSDAPGDTLADTPTDTTTGG
jgi:hypothetical protein